MGSRSRQYDCSESISLPSDCVGKIIGRGGSNVQRLESDYTVRVEINKNDCTVRVSGDSQSQVDDCVKSIRDQIESGGSRDYNRSNQDRGYGGDRRNYGRSNDYGDRRNGHDERSGERRGYGRSNDYEDRRNGQSDERRNYGRSNDYGEQKGSYDRRSNESRNYGRSSDY